MMSENDMLTIGVPFKENETTTPIEIANRVWQEFHKERANGSTYIEIKYIRSFCWIVWQREYDSLSVEGKSILIHHFSNPNFLKNWEFYQSQ